MWTSWIGPSYSRWPVSVSGEPMRKVPAGTRTKVIPIEFLSSRPPPPRVVDGPALVSGAPPTADSRAAALLAAAWALNALPRVVTPEPGGAAAGAAADAGAGAGAAGAARPAAAGGGMTAEPGLRSDSSFDPS